MVNHGSLATLVVSGSTRVKISLISNNYMSLFKPKFKCWEYTHCPQSRLTVPVTLQVTRYQLAKSLWHNSAVKPSLINQVVELCNDPETTEISKNPA